MREHDVAAVGMHLDAAGEGRLHRALRRCWQPVCRVADLGDRPIPVTLLDEQLVVVRLGNEIACFPDLCVHRGTALSLGWIDDGSQPAPDGSGTVGAPCLVCPYHGWSYDRNGVVRRIPAVHGRSIPSRARVTRYATAEGVGLVWVLLEPGVGGWEAPSEAYPLPRADSWWGRDGFRTIPIETYDWACSAARRVENFVDFSHFPWVHPDVLGDRAKPLSPEHEVVDDGTTISFDIALEEPQASVKGDAAPGAKVQRDPTTYTLHLPLSVTLDQRLPPSADRPDGNRFVLFLAVSPVTARRCRSFTWNARTYSLDPSADAELAAFQALILDQDRPIAESQRPEALPVDLSEELHIAGPDKASIQYRRRLAELAASG
ncbi:MAG TPA: aromatic ring-hydroxylating dioxygenase subunit alpha [Candidatus Limnocylindrales bacterium]|nr:aromatic ring-hydroxylating dioxygenase subunit alpha [Candidatus Limnocylindrales bacterium]